MAFQSVAGLIALCLIIALVAFLLRRFGKWDGERKGFPNTRGQGK